MKPNQTLQLTEQQKTNLRAIAKSFGLTVGRGIEADWGSIQKLAVAIADGRLAVVVVYTLSIDNCLGCNSAINVSPLVAETGTLTTD